MTIAQPAILVGAAHAGPALRIVFLLGDALTMGTQQQAGQGIVIRAPHRTGRSHGKGADSLHFGDLAQQVNREHSTFGAGEQNVCRVFGRVRNHLFGFAVGDDARVGAPASCDAANVVASDQAGIVPAVAETVAFVGQNLRDAVVAVFVLSIQAQNAFAAIGVTVPDRIRCRRLVGVIAGDVLAVGHTPCALCGEHQEAVFVACGAEWRNGNGLALQFAVFDGVAAAFAAIPGIILIHDGFYADA